MKSRAISVPGCSHAIRRQDQSCANFLFNACLVRRRLMPRIVALRIAESLHPACLCGRGSKRLASLVLTMIISPNSLKSGPPWHIRLLKRIAPQRRHRGTIASPTESSRQTSFEDRGYSGKCPKTHCESRIAHPCPMTASLGCPNRCIVHQENIKECYLNCRLQLNCSTNTIDGSRTRTPFAEVK